MKSAIGIGCFWFEPKNLLTQSAFESFNPVDFLSKIRSALESVDNVSSIEVHGEGNGFSLGYDSSDDDENLYFPIYTNLAIEFKLYLPFRIQEQYCHGYKRQHVTENFRIVINYDLEMPVTYIYQESIPDGSNDTSSPVMFIREYLKEKLKNDENCIFKCLGPSPFHADIFLNISQADKLEINARNTTLHSRGYGSLEIDIGLDAKEDPLMFFIAEYHQILESFYGLIRLQNRSLHYDIDVLNCTKKILQTRKRGLNKFRGNKDLIDSAYDIIFDDKLNRIAVERMISEKTREGIFNEENVFYSFIETTIQELSQIPINEVREILTISEERRRLLIQNISGLVAGLLGGIIGAIVGSFLTYKLTQISSPTSVQDTATHTQLNYTKE